MQIHGSLTSNLEAAILSARRLVGRPVYAETLAFWRDLSAFAWSEISREHAPATANLKRLVLLLDGEIADLR